MARINLALYVALTLTLVLGCGDDARTGSGDGGATSLDPSRTIGSLSQEEARSVCEEFVSAQGGAGTTVMCDGFEITVQSVDDCAASIEAATCANTVSELDACLAALDGDACKLLTDPACSFVPECAMSGM